MEPGNANVVRAAAVLAASLGQLDKAIALDRRSIELDPVAFASYFNLGIHTFYAGLLEESEAVLRKTLELHPQAPGAHMLIGRIHLAKGLPDSALAQMKQEPSSLWQMFGLVLAYHAKGKEETDAMLAELIKKWQNEAAYQIAQIYAYRGEVDKAFDWLERAFRQRDGGLAEMKTEPLLRNIMKDPRYPLFLKKMKLPI